MLALQGDTKMSMVFQRLRCSVSQRELHELREQLDAEQRRRIHVESQLQQQYRVQAHPVEPPPRAPKAAAVEVHVHL